MSRKSPVMDQFCECTNRGERTRMKRVVQQKMGTGTRGKEMAEVHIFTCPCCGYSKTIVDNHGEAFTQNDWNTMEARS